MDAATLRDDCRESPLFRGLSGEDLQRILDVMVTRKFEPGEVILRQGIITHNVWLLVEGSCEIVREPQAGEFGKTVQLAEIGPYETFGEMTMFHREPHAASVWAATDVTTIKLRRTDFQRLTEEHPAVACRLACNLVNILSDRLHRMDVWVTRLLDEHETAEIRQQWEEVRTHLQETFQGRVV